MKKTYYLRDAQGNVMSIYTLDQLITPPGEPEVLGLKLTERSIYGSSRVGTENPELLIARTDLSLAHELDYVQTIGDRRYELSNHLGNVLEVVSDRKLQRETAEGSGILDYYTADVVSQSDYFPFGMLLPGRTDAGDNDYRYGFQGQEMDDEIKDVKGSSVNYKYRMHDPRVGRFFAVDPLAASYPYNSPYAFSENRVLDMIELEGLEATSTTTINSDGSTIIEITIKIGVTNNSSTLTQVSVDAILDGATDIITNGLASNIDNTTITTTIEYVQNDPSIPIQVQFTDASVEWKGIPIVDPPGSITLGVTDEIGNTNNNNIQVANRGNSEAALEEMIKTVAHETGHALGLSHPDHDDARLDQAGQECFTCEVAVIDETEDPKNLMRQTHRNGNDSNLVPEQAQKVSEVIDDNGGNTTTDNRIKVREHKPLNLKKKRG